MTAEVPANILQDGIYTLSASMIACYIKCPRDFYYKHILNIPGPEGAAAGYGTAMHAAIQRISEGRNAGSVPTYDEIWQLVERKLPKRGFRIRGYQAKNV
ncbi:MAG: PD-(D/E)XK nuclease family protein [Candidatus Saccharibacteria bacterium]